MREQEEPAVPPVDELQQELERLRTQNRHLEQALASHAAVDQAIGVLAVLGRILPGQGFAVLREVSQHTNIKLSVVAEELIEHGLGAALPDPCWANCTLLSPATPPAQARRDDRDRHTATGVGVR